MRVAMADLITYQASLKLKSKSLTKINFDHMDWYFILPLSIDTYSSLPQEQTFMILFPYLKLNFSSIWVRLIRIENGFRLIMQWPLVSLL